MISTPPFTNYFLGKGFQSRGRMATACNNMGDHHPLSISTTNSSTP